MSRPPHAERTVSSMPATESGSVRSAPTAIAVPPASSMAATTFSARASLLRKLMTTLAPAAAR